jgi:beta-N-acetylhexosaminidase
MAEMAAVAAEAPVLSGLAAKRAEAALAMRHAPEEFDIEAARKMFTQMVGGERVAAQRMTGS